MSLKSPFIRNFASKIILLYTLLSTYHLLHGAIVNFPSVGSRHGFYDDYFGGHHILGQRGSAHINYLFFKTG